MPRTPDNMLVVRETERAVIYEDGVYSETLGPGRHYIPKRYRFFTCTRYPVYDILVVDMSEREIVVADKQSQSSDGESVNITTTARYRVDDPLLATTGKEKHEERLKRDIEQTIEQVIAGRSANEIVNHTDRLHRNIQTAIRDLAAVYGVRVLDVVLTKIGTTTLPVDVRVREIVLADQNILSSDGNEIRLTAVVDFTVNDRSLAISGKNAHQDRLRSDAEVIIEQEASTRTAQRIKRNRTAFSRAILQNLQPLARNYGLDVLDVKLKKLTA